MAADSNERRQTLEEALRYCGAGTRSATGVGRIGTYEHDVATGLSTWSQGLKDIVGTRAKDAIDPEQEWPIARALRGEHFIDFEVRVRNRHTGRNWIGSYGGTPVRSPDGALDVAIVTLRDVTAQREAEAALVRAKARIEIALTATEVGLWHWDLRRDRVLADANLLRLFGLGGEERELPLEPFLACMHPEDRRRVQEAGFDHHLVKPVGITGLKAVLSSVASPAAIADPADAYR